MNLSPAVIGLLRGVGFAVLTAVLTYFGDASHLSAVVSPVLAAAISSIVLAIEHSIGAKDGTALFGAANVR